MKHQYQYLDNASNLEISEGDTANWYTTRHKKKTYVIKYRVQLQIKMKTVDGTDCRLHGHSRLYFSDSLLVQILVLILDFG